MSADPIDDASETEELFRSIHIRNARANRPPITAAPRCLECTAVLVQVDNQPPRRWCDADCRDDWQRRQK